VTLGLFGLRGAQAERGPRAFAALAECCAPFQPGQRYQEFVRLLQPDAPPPPPPAFCFQEFSPAVHRCAPAAGLGTSAEMPCQAVGTIGLSTPGWRVHSS
jgi:hypothetical protein